MTNSTPNKILKALKGIKAGRTVPELAKRVGATESTARRSVNRLMERGALDYYAEWRKCSVTGKELTGYVIHS